MALTSVPLANTSKSQTLYTSLRAKIEHVQSRCGQHDRDSLIPKSSTCEVQVTVSNTALLAALMTLCADWGLRDPMGVDIGDLSDAISEKGESTNVTLDLSKTNFLEQSVRDLLPGYGLEQTSLLGFELEAYYGRLALMTSEDLLKHGA